MWDVHYPLNHPGAQEPRTDPRGSKSCFNVDRWQAKLCKNKPNRRHITHHMTSYHPVPNVTIDISLERLSKETTSPKTNVFLHNNHLETQEQVSKYHWVRTFWCWLYFKTVSETQNSNPTASFARKRVAMCYERHSQAAARITWGLTSGKRQSRAFFPEVQH